MAALVVGLVALGIAVAIGAALAIKSLVNAREDANKTFSSKCVDSPTQPCETAQLNPISPAQANSIFKHMAAKADDIPFDYPVDCCYSRAHEMCHMMEDEGVQCGKVWNYQKPGDPPGAPLRVDTDNVPSGEVIWRYHVAPIVDVRGDDGAVRTMVIDPSMFDKPVSVDEWRSAQNAPDSITQYTDASPYYRGIDGVGTEGDIDRSQTQQMLAIHKASRDSQDPDFTRMLEERRKERTTENAT